MVVGAGLLRPGPVVRNARSKSLFLLKRGSWSCVKNRTFSFLFFLLQFFLPLQFLALIAFFSVQKYILIFMNEGHGFGIRVRL